MSLNADALAYLVEKGLTAAELVEFARLQEKKADPTAADRKRRQREREKQSERDMSHRDVTRDPPPNDIYSNPPPNPQVSPKLSEQVESGEPALRPEHVVEVWNEMAGRVGLSRVVKLTPQRRRSLNTRIRQHSLDDWTEAIAAIERNRFLHGENDRGWRADFDFLLNPQKFVKLIEGGYDRTH
jgi:hypothetical protein